MLKISRLSDYGTTILKTLAQRSEGHISAAEIAAKTRLSQPTVSKILKQLHEAGLVGSIRGVNGGYHLVRDPKNISIKDIITAIDGLPAVTDCCKGIDQCEFETLCHLGDQWKFINKLISELLSGLSLSDMSQPLSFQVMAQKRLFSQWCCQNTPTVHKEETYV